MGSRKGGAEEGRRLIGHMRHRSGKESVGLVEGYKPGMSKGWQTRGEEENQQNIF